MKPNSSKKIILLYGFIASIIFFCQASDLDPTIYYYLYNAQFEQNDCIGQPLTEEYQCVVSQGLSYWSSYHFELINQNDEYSLEIAIQNQNGFSTNITNKMIVPLDVKHQSRLHHYFIITAATRKVGQPSNFNFQVYLYDQPVDKTPYHIFDFNFSELGTKTQIFSWKNTLDFNEAFILAIHPRDFDNEHYSSYQVGAGLIYANIFSCSSDQTLEKSFTTKYVCVSGPIKDLFPNCEYFQHNFIEDTYTCSKCAQNYDFITLTNGSTLCYSPATQNCQEYSSKPNSGYGCDRCKGSLTLVNGSSQKYCIDPTLVDQNCDLYTKIDGVYSCSTCKSHFTQVQLDTKVSKCISDSYLIRDCKIYKQNLSGYQCSECQPSSNTLSYQVQVNLATLARCLNPTSQFTQNCKTYEFSSNKYSCTVCLDTFIQKILTRDSINQVRCLNPTTEIISQCRTYSIDQSGNIVCTWCDTGFNLVDLTVDGSVKKYCLANTQIVPHCANYIEKNGIISCQNCNVAFGYLLVDALVSGKVEKRCITNHNSITYCNIYEPIQGSNCTYKCQKCDLTYELIPVKFTTRVGQTCLKDFVPLPYCKLYAQINGNFFCKHRYCQDSTEIQIGTGLNEIGCTKLTLNPNCVYYQRPAEGDELLRCAQCKDMSMTGYNCQTSE